MNYIKELRAFETADVYKRQGQDLSPSAEWVHSENALKGWT